MSGGAAMFEKRHEVRADVFGWNLTAHLIDPDDCWIAVCMLRGYETSSGIATCEMGLARAGYVQRLFSEYDSQHAEGLTAASVRLASGYFDSSENDETKGFYGEPMPRAAPKVIALYRAAAVTTTHLAILLGSRIGVPGNTAVEIGPLFDAVGDRFLAAMNMASVV